MGGNGPLVVLDDADVGAAAAASLVAAFLCAGQSCTAGERFLVHERVHDEFVERLRAAIAARDPPRRPVRRRDDDGPAQQRAHGGEDGRHVADALDRGRRGSRRRRAGGRLPDALYCSRPCSTASPTRWRSRREETFGPVVPISTIASDEEALQITNESPYGLLAAVWTRDLARGLRFAEAARAGWVNVNESTNYWESHLPFGGRAGSRSGVGRVGGRHAIDTFTELKTVVVSFGTE